MARHRHDGRGDFVDRTDATFARRLVDDVTCRPDRDPDRHDGYTWADVPRRPAPTHRAHGDLIISSIRTSNTHGWDIAYTWHPHHEGPALAGSRDPVR